MMAQAGNLSPSVLGEMSAKHDIETSSATCDNLAEACPRCHIQSMPWDCTKGKIYDRSYQTGRCENSS